ncbi:mechanosensitive ion channel family protein [Amorphus sp. MBR-141]
MTPDEVAARLQEAFPQAMGAWTDAQTALDRETLGFPLDRILVGLAVFVLFLALRRPLRYLIVTLFGRLAGFKGDGMRADVREALKGPAGLLPIALGAFLAFEILQVDANGRVAALADHVVGSLILIAVFWALIGLVGPMIDAVQPVKRTLSRTMIDWVKRVVKGLIIFLAGAAVLQEWGVQVGPLLAGMGIVGAAVALGAQDLFKNLIAGFLILIEKRFQYGDWIKVDGVVDGTVEYIGFRSTRIRNFDDTLAQVPNAALSENAVTNYTAMRRRRIYWTVGVGYTKSVDQLKEIRDGIERYILECGDFAPPQQASTFVRIDSFGSSSINIMVYCFTKTTVWGEWLQAKERLAYKMVDIVYGAGSSFAFPSTSLYVEKLPEGVPELFLPPDADGKPRFQSAAADPEGAGGTGGAASADTDNATNDRGAGGAVYRTRSGQAGATESGPPDGGEGGEDGGQGT